MKRHIIVFILLTLNSVALAKSSQDLAGYWVEPSLALLREVKMIDGKPIVVNVYTMSDEECIHDVGNTSFMRNMLTQASSFRHQDNQLKVYKLPTSQPLQLKKIDSLPDICKHPLNSQDPKLNFDVLWTFFNKYYPSFSERLPNGLSWRDYYHKYISSIYVGMPDRELFNVMGDMLGELHDEHIDLYYHGNPDDDLDINNDDRDDVVAFNKAFADSHNVELNSKQYIIKLGESFLKQFAIIDQHYLQEAYHGPERSFSSIGFPPQPVYTWGVVKNSRTGYLRILQELHFEGDHQNLLPQYKQAASTIDSAMAFFKKHQINKLIIDVRVNFGGEDAIDNYLIKYLITSHRIVAKTQSKINGELAPVKDVYLSPNHHTLRTEKIMFPIIVLTSNLTVSSGEQLTMELKALDNVTQIGYRTNGVFASTHTRQLPNGWVFQLPFNRNMDCNGRFYAGIGIPPDVPFEPSNNYLMKHYLDNNIDIILESAMVRGQVLSYGLKKHHMLSVALY